jgi:hypothetical protein
MTGFKEALLAELKAELADPDRPVQAAQVARRGPSPRLAVAAAGVAAVVAIGALLLPAQQAEPAYAVTTEDGMVTLKINFIGEPSEANRKLREAGVSAVIVLEKPDCEPDGGGAVLDDATAKGLDLASRFARASQTHTLKIAPSDIPAGQVLVVVPIARQGPGIPFVAAGLYRLPAPSCAPPWTGPATVPTPRVTN